MLDFVGRFVVIEDCWIYYQLSPPCRELLTGKDLLTVPGSSLLSSGWGRPYLRIAQKARCFSKLPHLSSEAKRRSLKGFSGNSCHGGVTTTAPQPGGRWEYP
ncbi:unnamed protein product [Discosporangium mesarthrocarpum]